MAHPIVGLLVSNLVKFAWRKFKNRIPRKYKKIAREVVVLAESHPKTWDSTTRREWAVKKLIQKTGLDEARARLAVELAVSWWKRRKDK